MSDGEHVTGERDERWLGALDAVSDALTPLGARGWIVGGCLRDALLGRGARDVDLAVTCEPATLAQALRRDHALTVAMLNRRTVRLGLRAGAEAGPLQLDISPLHGATIEDDLRQRDFRINALALPLAERAAFLALLRPPPPALANPLPIAPVAGLAGLLDPLDGRADLAARRLTPASDHAFRDEPGRILRAGRLVALGFTPTAETRALASAAVPALAALPADRVRDELNALLATPQCAGGLDFLAGVGALARLLPAQAAGGALAHALASVRATQLLHERSFQTASGDLGGMRLLAERVALRAWYSAPLADGQPRLVALRWGLLAHQHDPPALGETPADDAIIGALAGQERAIVNAIRRGVGGLRERLAGGEPDDRTLRRLFADGGEATVDILVAAVACNDALAEAPVAVAGPSAPALPLAAGRILDIYFADRQRLQPPPLLTGAELIRALDLAPGPEVGRLLARIRDAQLDGALTTQAEALAFARRLRG